jgi:hypothetical protein
VPEIESTRTDDDQPPSVTEPAAPRPENLNALRAQVNALESEQAELLEKLALSLEVENARLRMMDPINAPSFEDSQAPNGPISPAYLARALTKVEDLVSEMEASIAIGDQAAAANSKVKAASVACQVLRQLSEDDEFRDVLMTMQSETVVHQQEIPAYLRGEAPVTSPGNRPFRDVEVSLLRIAGLTEQLAQKHVDNAIAMFDAEPTRALDRMTNPMILLRDLKSLQEATCQSADLLSQGLRQQRSRQRWVKILTFGVGGTLIVAANAAGTALLGPVGIATSGAIGSAAIGAGVQLLS